MSASNASKPVTGNPWQLRVLTDNNAIDVVTRKGAAATVAANDADADDLFTGRQHPYFFTAFSAAVRRHGVVLR